MDTDRAPRDGWSMLLRREWLAPLAVLLGGILLHSMNVLMLATVLPTIVGELGGAALMSLPSTAFLASSIIAATCAGLGTATFGARNTYAAGAAVFTAGAIAIALAPAMEWVIAGRFVQGFGGGLIAGVAYVLVRSTFPEAAWARVIALLSGMWSVAILVGPLAGGVFAKYDQWRGSFVMVAAIAAVLALGAFRVLPSARTATARRSAFPGARLALVCAAIASSSSAAVVAAPVAKALLIALAVAFLAAMLRVDRKTPTPLLPSDAFAFTTPSGLGLWLLLLVAVAYSPLQIFIPVFLQSLHGLDPLTAGYGVACASLGWTAASLLVAGAVEDWRKRCIVLGPLAMLVSLVAAGLLADTHALLLCLAIIGIGTGIGTCWAFVAQRIMSGARKGEEAVTAASVPTVQQMGFALGAALSGLAANSAGFAVDLPHEAMAWVAFVVPVCFAASAAIACIVALRLNRTAH
ncbi:MAG: MFS transporter [Reyranella sp.]|uniref:MFS transporter n=1 Tax=Reyranella sp. TaxID=1929291 RepID=UPI001ACF3972|nr:MFS transporter [Reyranella sp.]MBN9089565.1 MFS transporter [Reyranella sp.]